VEPELPVILVAKEVLEQLAQLAEED